MYKNERNYEIDVIETAVRQVWSDIKSKSTSSESTKRIIAQVFGVYLNEVLHMLPPTDATAQQIRYKQRKTTRTIEYWFCHTHIASSTTLQHGGSFLLYDSEDINMILTLLQSLKLLQDSLNPSI